MPVQQRLEIQSLLPGGCRVSGGQGEIDATLQTQLDRIAMKLLPGNASGKATA